MGVGHAAWVVAGPSVKRVTLPQSPTARKHLEVWFRNDWPWQVRREFAGRCGDGAQRERIHRRKL